MVGELWENMCCVSQEFNSMETLISQEFKLVHS